jgi:hypothetical protein
MTHQCPGPGCEAEADSSMLMCPRCWRLVPAAVRRAVWIAWRRGAGAGTPAHREVVPASSITLKHPACGSAVESLPQAGPVSRSVPGGTHR